LFKSQKVTILYKKLHDKNNNFLWEKSIFKEGFAFNIISYATKLSNSSNYSTKIALSLIFFIDHYINKKYFKFYFSFLYILSLKEFDF